ncbi:hypothetical protein L218DRAFT_911695, partial [Marasmius fiardii PR-910]
MRLSDTVDGDLVTGYKEDIDTLLVFAGLFSSVVTAFTIEPYQWLQEDLADTTADLLRQISKQLSNPSQKVPPSLPEGFKPSPSVIRINVFWFLSLTLALVDALLCLLCKQWAREHQRKTTTRTPGQTLTLRWLRYQSFERWHVHKILASLPILPEMALFLFFAGRLELLWTRHSIPFAVAAAVTGFGVIFYLTTTVLPGLNAIQHLFRIYPYFATENPVFKPEDISRLPSIEFICSYRSPQSWLIFRLFSWIYRLPGFRTLLHFLINIFNRDWGESGGSIRNLDYIVSTNIIKLRNWSAFDMNLLERFSDIPRCPDLYQLKGFRWLVHGTRDIPSMIPHIKNVLREMDPGLVMPALFNRW